MPARIYLVQHGKAFTEKENPERPLTPEGIDDTTRIADALVESYQRRKKKNLRKLYGCKI